jgi:hypothetical protein
VKDERFAFQLLPCFFFLIWTVKAALEQLDIPSSSSEDSYLSSSPTCKLNLSILVLSAAIDRARDLMVAPFPLPFTLPLPFIVWHFPTWTRLMRLSLSVFF